MSGLIIRNGVGALGKFPKGRKKVDTSRRSFSPVRNHKSGPVLSYKADEFYQSRLWLDLRYKALVKYGARCQCCGRRRQDNVQIHVDHIRSRSHYLHLELQLDNLQVLCNECNIGKGALDHTDWR